MKKLLMITCAMAMFSGVAIASEYSHTRTVVTGEHSTWTRPDTGCNPATGNWVNAAVTTCMPNASGGNDFLRTREEEIPCPKDTKL